MMKWMTKATFSGLILAALLSPGVADAHGNVTMEEDICVRRIGGNMVHFSAYQPQFEPKAQYCTEIPEVGDTFLVVDLVDPGLRTMPVGVRIIRGQEGDGKEDDQTVAYIRMGWLGVKPSWTRACTN
jgi:hypothetical protein